MTFLEPLLLWGLPLALLPVLIHLFNRLRHRSMPWAAMMFLRSATRKSTRYARLRQFLILAFRVLAVLGLVLALSRPLAGGWAGWMFSGAPDVILLLLDRSASMETTEGQLSKREQAVRLMSQAAEKFQEASRIVFLDSTAPAPQEFESASILLELPSSAATDTAADLPGMLQAALDWMIQTKPGSAEIWIASDLQASNWDAKSDRWQGLGAGFAALPQRVRTRLLALNTEPAVNHSVSLVDAIRRQVGGRTQLELVIDVERSSASPATLPLTINLDGVVTQVELRMDGPTLRYRHKVNLAENAASGWGFVELPSDSNLRDNRSYFVYPGAALVRAAVVASEPLAARLLQVATAPDPSNTNQVCEILEANATETANLDDYSLILWHAPLPEGTAASRLQAFVEAGGVLVFFAAGQSGTPVPSSINGQSSIINASAWGEVQNAPAEKPYRIARWEEREGPLASTDEGFSLPVADLQVLRRQVIAGSGTALATFEDGMPFLTRQSVGRGRIFHCATQISREWSDLAEGVVLVPMLQRLIETGARRFAAPVSVQCGEWQPAEDERWTAVDSSASKNALVESGVYRNGAQLVAVNRPLREDERELVDATDAKALLDPVPIQLFDEKQSGAARAQAELWRLFLIVMALCLVIEGVLILPEKVRRSGVIGEQGPSAAGAAGTSDPRKREEVAA